jgi:hypothetical protein
MLRGLLKKSKLVYFVFFLISASIWAFLFNFRPLELKKDLWIWVYSRQSLIGGAKIHINGKISPFSLSKITDAADGNIFLNLDEQKKTNDLKNFSLSKFLQNKLGYLNYLNGDWEVIPEMLDLEQIIERKAIKKKLKSPVKILNPMGYCLIKHVFEPDSVYDFNDISDDVNVFHLSTFLYEIKKNTDTMWLNTPKGIYPEKIKFYVRAEPYHKIQMYLKIRSTPGQIVVPDSVYLVAYVPVSLKDSVKNYIVAFTEEDKNQDFFQKTNVFVQTKSEFFLISNYHPCVVKQYRWKN